MTENLIDLVAHLDQERETAVDWFHGSDWLQGHLRRFSDLLIITPEAFIDEAEPDEIDCISDLHGLRLFRLLSQPAINMEKRPSLQRSDESHYRNIS